MASGIWRQRESVDFTMMTRMRWTLRLPSGWTDRHALPFSEQDRQHPLAAPLGLRR
jgi:hypothetical protein